VWVRHHLADETVDLVAGSLDRLANSKLIPAGGNEKVAGAGRPNEINEARLDDLSMQYHVSSFVGLHGPASGVI
jgi:hypothetical protein